MMEYQAKITKHRGGYLVEFPDLPGCLTEGNDLTHALKNAEEALTGWLSSHCDRALDVPEPKRHKGKQYHSVQVPLQVEFALRLRSVRLTKKLTQTQIAKRLGISQQAYAKFEIPQSANPSLITIQKISKALDADVEIQLVA